VVTLCTNRKEHPLIIHSASLCVCVFISKQKAIISLYSSNWLVSQQRFESLQYSGHHIYHQIYLQRFYVLPTQNIYMSCVDLRKNQQLFPYKCIKWYVFPILTTSLTFNISTICPQVYLSILCRSENNRAIILFTALNYPTFCLL